MIENKEVELKMLLTKEEFYSLLEYYQPANFIKQTNHYFSSDNKSNYQSIRIREKEGKYLFTLKEKQDGYVQEYEKYTDSLTIENDEEIINILNNRKLYAPYYEIGQLTTERYTHIIQNKAELCFDINTYYGITDYEIEYEVTHPHNHLEDFLAILQQANITFKENPISKVKRCLQQKEAVTVKKL